MDAPGDVHIHALCDLQKRQRISLGDETEVIYPQLASPNPREDLPGREWMAIMNKIGQQRMRCFSATFGIVLPFRIPLKMGWLVVPAPLSFPRHAQRAGGFRAAG